MKKYLWIFSFILISKAEAQSIFIDSLNSQSIDQQLKGSQKKTLTATKTELQEIGEKIFLNETGGKKENLIAWNKGENFMSLGIGHFIWYKENEKENFEESFPSLIQFYQQNMIQIPDFFIVNKYVPWKNREEFLEVKKHKLDSLINFFDSTKDIQILFIFQRLEASLGKMLEIIEGEDNKNNVVRQFYRVAQSPNGLYALIDYVNFKGEGTKLTERYKGEGWGLLQILENMKGDDSEVLTEFRQNAKFVLERRVANSNPERNEKQWLKGWIKRCDTYR